MPRKKGQPGEVEIPSTIRRSDKHARDIWKETHDSAVETYGEGERAHRTAFASLKHSYRKEGDHWVKKARRDPSDPQAARGPTTARTSTGRDPALTAGGQVAGMEQTKHELYERARSLHIKGRSAMTKEELAEAVMAHAKG